MSLNIFVDIKPDSIRDKLWIELKIYGMIRLVLQGGIFFIHTLEILSRNKAMLRRSQSGIRKSAFITACNVAHYKYPKQTAILGRKFVFHLCGKVQVYLCLEKSD